MSDAMIVWTQEQKDLIKRTVATDASDAELAMFLHIASKAGLDPLQKQIHFTKRQGRVTVIAGIDGLQARAAREPDYEGILSGVVCAKDDFEFDASQGKVVRHKFNAFADRGAVQGAWATVQRKGKLPFTAVVRFEEFCQKNSPTWHQMPHVMIQKVAKSTALRLAYPEQFGGIYEKAEMDQAGPADAEKEVNTAPRAKGLEAIPTLPSTTEPTKAPPTFDVLAASMDELAERAMELEEAIRKKPKARNVAQAQMRLAEIQAEMQARAVADSEPPRGAEDAQVEVPF